MVEPKKANGVWPPEWPYDWTATETRLSPAAIEQHGSFLLSRALNIRRLIAFLGSGASIPYGRVSWTELATLQIERLLKIDPRSDDPRRALLDDLRMFKGNKALPGEQTMLALQLCEQVWSLTDVSELNRLCTDFSIPDGVRDTLKRQLQQPELGRRLMRAWIARETFDELPHMRRLLAGELGGEAKDPPPPLAKWRGIWNKAITEITESRELNRERVGIAPRYYRRLLHPENLQKITKAATADPLLKALVTQLQNVGREPVAPRHYYILSLLLDVLRLDEFEHLMVGRAKAPDALGARREDVIPVAADILRKLVTDLEIGRFLTTNYDLEFERLLHDLGYEIPRKSIAASAPTGESERISPLGSRARDTVLDERTASDLIDCALEDPDYALQVVHLHGRATDDADVVVTERDYQLKYVRDDRAQQVFREGLDLAFGGNPILFVGVGMSEGDVLRPMREFAAGLSRRNQSVIALLPATDNENKRRLYTMQQYSRYGVHIVHFGYVSAPKQSFDWLARLTQAIKELADKLADESFIGGAEATFEESLGKHLSLGIWRLKVFETTFKRERLSPFLSDGGMCDIGADIATLRTIAQLADAYGSNKDFRQKTLRTAIDRARSSIISAALAAKLDGIKADWQAWWERWREPLIGRETTVCYARDPAKKANIFFRHPQQDQAFRTWVARAENGKETQTYETKKSAQFDRFFAKASDSCAGRRVFVIPGTRGSGKGHVFSIFAQESARLQQLYAAQLHVGFSFSSEIASVMDKVVAFVGWGPDCEGAEARQATQQIRLEALQQAIERCAANKSSGERLLVVFNTFGTVFERSGKPKTSEIARFVEALLGPKAAGCNLDIVIITRISLIAEMYRSTKAAPPRVQLAALPSRYGPFNPDDVRRLKENQVAFDPAPTDESRNFIIISEADGKDWQQQYDRAIEEGAFPGFKDWLAANSKAATPLEPGPLADNWAKLRSEIAQFVGRAHLRHHAGLALAVLADISDRQGGAIDALPLAWPRLRQALRDIRHYDETRGGPEGDQQSGAVLIDRVFEYWYINPGVGTDPNLCEAIVRHLAVIGIPVEAEVILSCPAIKAHGHTPPTLDVLTANLETLARRGLVFKITPSTTGPGAPAPSSGVEAPRWAVHRTMQHFVYRRLGAQRDEPADALLLAPSLYSAQSSGFVQLGARGYAFIYDLVDELVSYPGRVPLDGEPPLPDKIKLYHAQLRAALGVVRTLFSVGIVSRFNDLEGLEVPMPPKLGYFEHHRKVLRWMIRFAGHLQWVSAEHDERCGVTTQSPTPYYRDEIVWLHNECGVFSLAQGELYDAYALLSMAAKLNRNIEDNGDGANGLRIRLNIAHCLIDRGRLDAAATRLDEIKSAPDCDPLLKALADGHLAMIDGIRGNAKAAIDGYDKAIDELRDQGRHRPISIFHRCRADMLRHIGHDDAEAGYRDAIRAATTGGNIDLLHYGYVGLARHKALHDKVDNGVRRSLDEAIRYAEAMELPRLKAEALYVRGEILLRAGETSLAGTFATRALRIATLSGLALRKTAYSYLLARIYLERGDVHGAEQLFAKTKKRAQAYGYNVLVDRINATQNRDVPRGA